MLARVQGCQEVEDREGRLGHGLRDAGLPRTRHQRRRPQGRWQEGWALVFSSDSHFQLLVVSLTQPLRLGRFKTSLYQLLVVNPVRHGTFVTVFYINL